MMAKGLGHVARASIGIFACVFFIVLASTLAAAPLARAEESDTSTSTPEAPPDPAALALQAQIDESTANINRLSTEITQLQTQLDSTTKQKQTLQSAVQALNLNIQKLTKSISLTQAQIAQKDSQIKTLSGSISVTSGKIGQSQGAVGESLRQLVTLDDESLVIVLMGGETLSSFFEQLETLAAVRSDLRNRIEDLSSLKTNLLSSKTVAQQKRDELAALKRNLSEQKAGLAIARDAQNQLLAQTKNQESNYQALIEQKKMEQAQFEQDLLKYEGQLDLTVSSGALPSPGPVLVWPVANPRITQYFGNTPFATANPQIYSGHGHTGVDLAASPGTPIKAARAGVVVGTGDTDLTCRYASFGRWIFIQHDDGLSTIYAHLSVMLVSSGERVATGQLIGYSGTTGYATGPHLHFGVYATSGTKIASFPSAGCRPRMFTIPVGTLSAYLNPLTYLPSAKR